MINIKLEQCFNFRVIFYYKSEFYNLRLPSVYYWLLCIMVKHDIVSDTEREGEINLLIFIFIIRDVTC